MTWKQREIFLLLTFLSIYVEEGRSDRDPAEGGGESIKVAICKPGYQPFAFLDSNGKAKGHDVVLMNMLYDKVGDCAHTHVLYVEQRENA